MDRVRDLRITGSGWVHFALRENVRKAENKLLPTTAKELDLCMRFRLFHNTDESLARVRAIAACFVADCLGFAITVELLLVTTIGLLGLIIGATSIRTAIISEASDVAGAFQDLTQAYNINGMTSHSSQSPGMEFIDELDFCDSNEDAVGVVDNCIVINDDPSPEGFVPEGAALSLLFGDDTSDTSTEGNDNSGALRGDAEIVDGTLNLDGDGDFVSIPNSTDINIGVYPERTIALDFKADDVTTRQVLYAEGATVRGLVIYIDSGDLYIGGWNIPDGESGWDPVYISTPITAGQWFSVGLVLDAGPAIVPDALTGYFDGDAFGAVPGSQLWPHGGMIGIGGVNDATIFHDGPSSAPSNFDGMIDNFHLYNDALSDAEMDALAN